MTTGRRFEEVANVCGHFGPALRMAQYGKMFKNEPSLIGSLGAQAVEVLAGAMDKAGGAREYDKIAATMKGQPWKTLLGEITFDGKGQALHTTTAAKHLDPGVDALFAAIAKLGDLPFSTGGGKACQMEVSP